MTIRVISGTVTSGHNFTTGTSSKSISLKKDDTPIRVSTSPNKRNTTNSVSTTDNTPNTDKLKALIANLPSYWLNSPISDRTGTDVLYGVTIKEPDEKPFIDKGENLISQMLKNFQTNAQDIISDARNRLLEFKNEQLGFYAENTRLNEEKDLLQLTALEKLGFFRSNEEANIQGLLAQQAFSNQQNIQIPILEERLRLLEMIKQNNPIAAQIAEEQGLSLFDKIKGPLLIAGIALIAIFAFKKTR